MAKRMRRSGPDEAELLRYYEQMLLIRRFEEKCAEMYTLGHIGGFTHLYIGQEAVAVGAISALRADDYVVSNYRDHGHALAKGSDPNKIMAELFGKSTGVSRGKGGSMHLFDSEHGFLGGYAIVGAGMPLATGVGMAIAYRGSDQVALCFFGDGAVNEGAFHESLNLAALWRLPVVFLLENNQYAMGTAVATASSMPELYKRSCAYGIEGERVDGMDVQAVREATLGAVERARDGKGPTLLEALTYRFRGHSMADPVYYRSKQEEEHWRGRDPIALLAAKLTEEGVWEASQQADVEQRVEQRVDEAVRFALESVLPDESELYTDTCVDSFCPAYVRGAH